MLVWAHEGISDSAWDVLRQAGHVVVCNAICGAPPEQQMAIWTRLSPPPMHPELPTWWPLQATADQVRVVATPCTDSSHCEIARARGVKVLSLRDCGDLSGIRASTEFSISAILDLARNVSDAVSGVDAGRVDRMEYQGTDLYEKTVGVIGWGRIGRGVAEILIAFGCNVIGYDPAWPNLSTLDELLRTADVITIHANLNESSRGMIGHAEFGKMKDGVMISNTARGKIIDEAAMLAALKSGKVAAAFLDVTRDEPLSPDSELVRYRRENPRRLKLTPHIAGNSKESLAKAEMLLAKRLVRELESLDSAQRCEAGHSLTGRTKPQTGHVSKS